MRLIDSPVIPLSIEIIHAISDVFVQQCIHPIDNFGCGHMPQKLKIIPEGSFHIMF